MVGLDQLVEGIAEVLWANVSAPQLPTICSAFGLTDGDEGEAYSSKRAYVRKRITGWSRDQLVQLAKKIQETYPSDSLQLVIEAFVPEQFCRISDITRQHLINDVLSLGPLEGKLDLLDFLGKLWKLDSGPSSGWDFRCSTLRVRNLPTHDSE